MAIFFLSTELLLAIKSSWETNVSVARISQWLQENPGNEPNFTWKEGILR